MNRSGKAVSITNRCCGEPIFSRTAQTMMLTMKRTRTRELELRPSGYLNLRFFHGCGCSSRGSHADGTITQLLPEIGTKRARINCCPGKLVMKKAGMEDLPRSIFRACLYHLYLHSHLTRHFQIYRLRIGFPVNSSVSRGCQQSGKSSSISRICFRMKLPPIPGWICIWVGLLVQFGQLLKTFWADHMLHAAGVLFRCFGIDTCLYQ